VAVNADRAQGVRNIEPGVGPGHRREGVERPVTPLITRGSPRGGYAGRVLLRNVTRGRRVPEETARKFASTVRVMV
jgi:hypothetical protein